MALRKNNNPLDKKMKEEDYNKWSKFKSKKGFTDNDLEIVYRFHADYFNHNYNIPCGCGGARKIDVINGWIKDLDKVFENGMETKELPK